MASGSYLSPSSLIVELYPSAHSKFRNAVLVRTLSVNCKLAPANQNASRIRIRSGVCCIPWICCKGERGFELQRRLRIETGVRIPSELLQRRQCHDGLHGQAHGFNTCTYFTIQPTLRNCPRADRAACVLRPGSAPTRRPPAQPRRCTADSRQFASTPLLLCHR